MWEEFWIFIKPLKTCIFPLCFVWSAGARNVFFFTADVFLKSLQRNLRWEAILLEGARWVANPRAPGDVFEKREDSLASPAPTDFQKLGSSKTAVRLLWHFPSMPSTSNFCLTSSAFTKYDDLFHLQKRSWRMKRSYEHQNLHGIWTVWGHRESGALWLPRDSSSVNTYPCSALLFISKCFSLLCLLRTPNKI